jgi:hypothetical protein
MMEDAALSPTLEQLKRDEYIPPEVNQHTHRRAWRRVTVFENLFNRGEIEMFQLRAAQKVEMHFHGAQGADVRFTDESSGYNDDCEYPRTWHAQKLAQAQAQLRPREWLALIDIIMGASLEEVGRKWRAVGKREIARAQGLVLVSEGLDVLGSFWGLSNEKKTRRPSL